MDIKYNTTPFHQIAINRYYKKAQQNFVVYVQTSGGGADRRGGRGEYVNMRLTYNTPKHSIKNI